uniref:Protein kinase domain-containing protein n=1 Tax=Quercus lobata TaxID=97700 RepID=A0A7N2N7C8_QUELO
MVNEEEYPSNSYSYKILEQIGVGANSIIYKAICLAKNSTEVAIKTIVDDQSREDVINKFKSITHPNIVKVYCSFMVDGSLWLIMPFLSTNSIESIVTSSFQNRNPYWIASEVKSPNPNLVDGYSMKIDIWAFGVTALELALGCLPLSACWCVGIDLFARFHGSDRRVVCG